MKGTSQASHDAVLSQFAPVAEAAGKDGSVIAAQLFAAAHTLDSSASLRRALTDPARPAEDKAALVADLFSASDSRVIDVASAAVSARWSSEDDLAGTLEDAGVAALLGVAAKSNDLTTVEEELFRVERLLAAERDLLASLGNRTADPAAKQHLAAAVFKKDLHAVTFALLEHAVTAPRGRRLQGMLEGYIAAAAELRDKSVAHVTAAVELSAKQRAKLATILQTAYGREMQLNVAVDPSLIGGMRIQVGPNVVDGTMLSRLDEARRRLVG